MPIICICVRPDELDSDAAAVVADTAVDEETLDGDSREEPVEEFANDAVESGCAVDAGAVNVLQSRPL